MEKTKKAFQNVIAKIRKETGSQFPKAMMTGQQMRKSTATVNCGGEVKAAESKELAEKVLNDERFNEFLKKYEADALVEAFNIAGKTAYQVRVLFNGYGEEESAEPVAEEPKVKAPKVKDVLNYTNKKGRTYNAANMISNPRFAQMLHKGYTRQQIFREETVQEAYDRLAETFETVRIYSDTKLENGIRTRFAMCR